MGKFNGPLVAVLTGDQYCPIYSELKESLLLAKILPSLLTEFILKMPLLIIKSWPS